MSWETAFKVKILEEIEKLPFSYMQPVENFHLFEIHYRFEFLGTLEITCFWSDHCKN